MFTGIIETLGTVRNILRNQKSLSIFIETDFDVLVMGESIAVNGVCLTVCRIEGSAFCADVTPETFSRTSLSSLFPGCHVNLERAMKADGRFGGHIVSGHVDGTARIASFSSDENAVNLRIVMEKSLGNFMIEKGSLCVDGISLTVASVDWSGNDCVVSVAVIPHTWNETILHEKKQGSIVNIECDIVGKYISHFVNLGQPDLKNDVSNLFTDFISYH